MYKSERKRIIDKLKKDIASRREQIKRERNSMKGATDKDAYRRRIENRKGEIERLKNQIASHRASSKTDRKG